MKYRTYVEKTLTDYRVGRNLELHKHWGRPKIALKLGWVNDKQVLHKNIALLEYTWKGDEVAELKMNRMSIESIYIEQAWNCIKGLNQHKPIESGRPVNYRIEKTFRSDYVNRKIS